MFEYHVTFRALSAAQKARRYLTEEGIGAVLSRSPKTMSEQGCGFVLRLSAQDAMFAIGILRRRSAAFGRMYRVFADGRVQEVRL